MRIRTPIMIAVVLSAAFALCGLAQPAQPAPRVHLVTTGGTIAGGATGSLEAEDFLKLVPDLATIQGYVNRLAGR